MKQTVILEFDLEHPVKDLATKIASRVSVMQGIDAHHDVCVLSHDQYIAKFSDQQKAPTQWESAIATVAKKAICD